MDKKQIHHYWKYAKVVKPWQLLLLFALCFVLSLSAYRQNSKNVIPLVESLITADKSGIGTDEALRELGNYMTNHMNSSISSPIQLNNSFYRAYEVALKSAQPTVNNEVYKLAQSTCEVRSKTLSERAICIQEYVTNNAPAGQNLLATNLPTPEDYTYTFITPLWSPDLAGWMIVLTMLVGVIFVSRIVAAWLVRRTLHNHL